jgi:hypothetical protein
LGPLFCGDNNRGGAQMPAWGAAGFGLRCRKARAPVPYRFLARMPSLGPRVGPTGIAKRGVGSRRGSGGQSEAMEVLPSVSRHFAPGVGGADSESFPEMLSARPIPIDAQGGRWGNRRIARPGSVADLGKVRAPSGRFVFGDRRASRPGMAHRHDTGLGMLQRSMRS